MPRVLIDPGHGGEVGGSRGVDGALEKHVTLRLARAVRDHLAPRVDVRLTRDRDATVSLAERARMVQTSGAGVFLSLHANSGQPADSGTETWVHPQAGAPSLALAAAVRGRFARLGGRDRGLFAGDLHLLRPALQADAAACLIELDYLTSPAGARRLQDPAEVDRMGRAIAAAVLDHLGARPTYGDGYEPDVDGTPTAVDHDPDLPAWARDLSPRRRRMLAVLAGLLPQAVDGAGPAYYDQGGAVINSNGWWDKNNSMTSCTTFNPKVIAAFYGDRPVPYGAQWAFSAGGQRAWDQNINGRIVKNRAVDPQPGWRLFTDHTDQLPKPGDTYLLWSDAAGGLRHVGTVCHVPDPADPDDCWVTADGGQGPGKAQRCELVPRSCVRRAVRDQPASPANTPHLGGGAEGLKEPLPRLYGWVDLDDPTLADHPAEHSDAAFKDLVQRIERVRSFHRNRPR
jgi:hypothetical protein